MEMSGRKLNLCNGGNSGCLYIKITEECNAKCDFCFAKKEERTTSSIISDNLINIINSLDNYNKVMIQGGEPLVYPELLKVVGNIKNKRIYINTNGFLLDENLAEKLSEYITGINISVHHYDAVKNEKITGLLLNMFNLYNAIKMFNEKKISVRLYCNLIKGSIDTIEEVKKYIAFARLMSVSYIRFSELKYAPEQFVDPRNIFEKLPEDPYTAGCEIMQIIDDMMVKIKMQCWLINEKRKKPLKIYDNEACVKVIYPDGSDVIKPIKKKHQYMKDASPATVLVNTSTSFEPNDNRIWGSKYFCECLG